MAVIDQGIVVSRKRESLAGFPGADSCLSAFVAPSTGDSNKIAGVSYSQSVFRNSSFYATAFVDLEEKNSFGIYAGLTVPFGNDINVSTSFEQTAAGTAGVIDVSKSQGLQEDSYGWRLRTREGVSSDQYASASYRGRYAQVQGSVERYDGAIHATAQIDGAIAVADGGIFASNRIDDAFAVVDVGAPDVNVSYENRPVGRTNSSGRILVPDMKSWQPNTLAIDPKDLPVDASVGVTTDVVVPADRSGVVVNFNVAKTTASALVSFVDSQGIPLEAGLRGEVVGSGTGFVIGYDGEAYLAALGVQNSVTIDLTDGKSCHAQFPYQAKQGSQVKITKVVCS